jgi:hypothetical protein
MEKFHQVVLPYATFGLISEDERITITAPIAKWARGKPLVTVLDYYRRKGARIIEITGPAKDKQSNETQ